ncbi:MAG: GNAT family N-acetyltransferase [Nitrospinae bacterium]|nr:GNAT family N-acetyltransferase [Nitrospinota bacterium]
MPIPPKWSVFPLNSKKHKRKNFSCGNEALDRYLAKQATQDIKRKLARVFVVCEGSKPEVLGFYTLSAASFDKKTLSPDQAKRIPYPEVPAVLIGRLAVDQSRQGQGLGGYLLIDACKRILDASLSSMAVHAVLVKAKDESAKSFYMKYGFIPFEKEPFHLFLPVKTILSAYKF